MANAASDDLPSSSHENDSVIPEVTYALSREYFKLFSMLCRLQVLINNNTLNILEIDRRYYFLCNYRQLQFHVTNDI